MIWPTFDFAEVINQTISAVVTVLGVFIGGRLAFSFGIRQLRHERAIDRRIESQEVLLSAMENYRSELQLLRTVLATTRDDPAEAHQQMLGYVQKQAIEKSREFGRALSRAELFSTTEESVERRPLLIARFAVDVIAARQESTSAVPEDTEETLTSAIGTLQEQQQLLVQRIRGELALLSSTRRSLLRGAGRSAAV